MIINLTVGDYGGDGHGKTAVVPYYLYDIEHISHDQLTEAYRQGCTILGHDLEQQCADDEEYKLTPDFIAALERSGIPAPEDMGTVEFAELYLKIAQLAHPSLTWDRIVGENIDVGGYGLFFN